LHAPIPWRSRNCRHHVLESFAAIDAFAGADREAAVVAPEAAALLTDFDKRVRHYELGYLSFFNFRSVGFGGRFCPVRRVPLSIRAF